MNNNDYTLIFEQIDKFNTENPSFSENFINEEDLINDETIREFCEICKEMRDDSCDTVEFISFS